MYTFISIMHYHKWLYGLYQEVALLLKESDVTTKK